ncbi:MAG: hypothetical protein OHK0046_07830 [Anaerolineae bacterium]
MAKTGVEIRPAHLSDAPPIAEIIMRVWPTSQNESRRSTDLITQIEAGLSQADHRAFVAADGPRVVGFVDSFPSQNRWELDLLAVDPDYHGRGIAGELIAASDEAGRAAGFFLTRALVQVENDPMMRALSRMGYSSDQKPQTLYVCDGGLAAVDAASLLPVHTLTYEGAWIEGEVIESDESSLTPGTVVGKVVDHEDHTTRTTLERLAFEALDHYCWWVKTL